MNAISSMLYDGKEISGVLGVRGRELTPEIDLNKIETPGMDGSLIAGVRIKAKEIRVNVLVEVPEEIPNLTNMDTMRAVGDVLFSVGDASFKKMIFEDDPERFWLGAYQGSTLIKEGHDFAEIEISFFCHPYCYAVDELEIPFSGREIGVTNDGRFTDCEISLVLPSSLPRFEIGIFGTNLKVVLIDRKGNGLSGEWGIKSAGREVLSNGVLSNDVVDFENTNWIVKTGEKFGLKHGKTVFNFSESVLGGWIKFRKRWL